MLVQPARLDAHLQPCLHRGLFETGVATGYRGRRGVCKCKVDVNDRNLNNSALSHRSELYDPGMLNSLSVGEGPIYLLPGLWAPVSRGLGLAAPCLGGDVAEFTSILERVIPAFEAPEA